MTVTAPGGSRERIQFKNTDSDSKPLMVETFTSDKRDLRLDRLVASAVADREGPGRTATAFTYRVVLRDSHPEDIALVGVLLPANPDPGPFVPGMPTRRFRFDVDRLWPLKAAGATTEDPSPARFKFLRTGAKAVNRADLAWVTEHLIIEVEAPRSSGLLLEPGPAEQILLSRSREDIGAGLFPNAGRSPEDVAGALITFARQARQDLVVPSAEAILRRAQIRRDFGAVSQAHPVDRRVEVVRATTVNDIQAEAEKAAELGVPLVLQGPPGQGKSWVGAQLLRSLSAAGWLVAEHYCYLNDTLDERDERVQAEAVFGSLLRRLADADPSTVEAQRPRYAADDVALAAAVSRSLESKPDRKVALIVDGLDHVTRVLPSRPGGDPSKTLASTLAALGLAPGSVLIVLSQPGEHLAPLLASRARTMEIPRLTRAELTALAANRGLIGEDASTPAVVDHAQADAFLAALLDRSGGNALYATYLCREVLARPQSATDPTPALLALPQYDGTLENYYTHLTATLGLGVSVAEAVSLLDFPVTRAELEQIRPDLAHWINDALTTLAPVLAEHAGQGGLRVYHESFARFLRRRLETHPGALAANLRPVIDWLDARGFFADERAFRFLLPALAAVGRDTDVLSHVDADFAINAVAGGHPASAITANLAIATRSAGRMSDLPALTRCVELAHAADSFDNERLDDDVVDYVDVPMALLGSEQFTSRLLFDGKIALPPRAGLLMCAAVDAAGAVAPWSDYLPAYAKWQSDDNTMYDQDSNRDVALAQFRGKVRQAVTSNGVPQSLTGRLTRFLGTTDLEHDAIIEILANVIGLTATEKVVDALEHPQNAALCLAELLHRSIDPDLRARAGKHLPVAVRGYAPGSAHRLLALGAEPDAAEPAPTDRSRTRLIKLTQQVTGGDAMFRDKQASPQWLDQCAIAARRGPEVLDLVEGMLTGEGWYRCWLRFVLGLVRAETSPDGQAQRSLEALRCLTGDLRPFTGKPRACDLYPIRGEIAETIRRAVALLDDHTWADGISVLQEVTENVGVSLRGQDSGPLTPDFLLSLVVSTATTPVRRTIARLMIDDVLTHGAGNRYYSALAEYRLMAARFALAGGDISQARSYWNEACQLMTAYGYHKDITIYEVLDPMPNLIAADSARARTRLARVQPTCDRVNLHTDRKSIRGTWTLWWRYLATADPAALTQLIVPARLQRCGQAHDLHNGALEDLWRTWQHRADPIVAGALRLALPMPLDPTDCAIAQRLTDAADGTGSDLPGRLLTLVLARADERPLRYPYDSSDDTIAQDNALIEEINAITARVAAPRITVDTTPPTAAPTPSPRPPPTREQQEPAEPMPAGVAGIARAIRAWRRRPYEATGPEWDPDRFANIIGFRMVGMDPTEEADAEAALHSLANAFETLDRSGLLTSLGHGLQRLERPRLAAVALTLAWTRERAGGGWLTFGGETGLDSLRQATQLDPIGTWETVVTEVTRIVAGARYGSHGVTQALIHASIAGALQTRESALDASFAAWDAAQSVIERRTPRMAEADDPDEPYEPSEPIDDPASRIDVVFCEAIIAMLAHPGFEVRRRAMLAVDLLLHHRADTMTKALTTHLAALHEPAVLSWLLKMVADASAASAQVVAECRDTLRQLAGGAHLTVRALASQLLGGDAGPPPMTTPDPRLLAAGLLWQPDSSEPTNTPAHQLVGHLAGNRLLLAEELLPGLADAVVARVKPTLADPARRKSLDAEANELADTRHKRWPDAFTGRHHLVEDALQRAAAGGRAALLAVGSPPADATTWEQQLADALVNDPALPIEVEWTRHPRPAIEPPPARDDPIWTAADDGSTPVISRRNSPDGDLVISLNPQSLDQCGTLETGRFRLWRVIASAENEVVLPVWPEPDDALRESSRERAVEVRQPGDRRGLPSRPFAGESTMSWFKSEPPLITQVSIPDRSQPLIAIDLEGDLVADTHVGLGMHSLLLEPTPLLKQLLGLHPVEDDPFVLHDDTGPALAMITWRNRYETSDYHLPWSRAKGTAIVISPEAFATLAGWGKEHLAIREVIHGDASLPEPADV